jgi:Family of unknown function (DUF5320)
MPNRDGTGPERKGPRTGRGMGPCGLGFARRLGARGVGRGFGFRVQSVEPVVLTEDEERKVLRKELEDIEAEKAEVEKRLKELGQ